MVEKKIGERLRETRKERGLTQKQVSEMLDISIDYVSRLEKGERTPSDRVRRWSWARYPRMRHGTTCTTRGGESASVK
jgi:DNA-binding XRE family transcriptional regulator